MIYITHTKFGLGVSITLRALGRKKSAREAIEHGKPLWVFKEHCWTGLLRQSNQRQG